MIGGPCKVDGIDCQDRHPGRHGQCEKFAEYRKKMDAIREARQKHKELNRLVAARGRRYGSV